MRHNLQTYRKSPPPDPSQDVKRTANSLHMVHEIIRSSLIMLNVIPSGAERSISLHFDWVPQI